VNVAQFGGSNGTFSSGRPSVDVNSLASNSITAGVIADAAIDRATFAADTGLAPIRSNTAQAGASTTITLDASASATNSFYNNDLVLITGGTGAGQARFVTAYVGSTKVATVATWATNPDNTSTFAILPFDSVPGGTAPTAAQISTAVWQDIIATSDFTTEVLESVWRMTLTRRFRRGSQLLPLRQTSPLWEFRPRARSTKLSPIPETRHRLAILMHGSGLRQVPP
jgi:hypothetical protein